MLQAGLQPTSLDFTEDPDIGQGRTAKKSKKEVGTPPPAAQKKLTDGQNPVAALNEIKPGLVWECSETGSSPSLKKFHMKFSMDGMVSIRQAVLFHLSGGFFAHN